MQPNEKYKSMNEQLEKLIGTRLSLEFQEKSFLKAKIFLIDYFKFLSPKNMIFLNQKFSYLINELP